MLMTAVRNILFAVKIRLYQYLQLRPIWNSRRPDKGGTDRSGDFFLPGKSLSGAWGPRDSASILSYESTSESICKFIEVAPP